MKAPDGRVWCVSVLLLGVAGLALSAQGQRPPVFRGGTTFVSVDAYPRRDGRFIDNLRKEDFTVLEDGKPQAIDRFELVRFAPNPIDADRVDPSSVADSERQAADPHGRLFVVYLDTYHADRNGSRDSRQPVIDFLNRTITRADLFAVTTTNSLATALTFARRTETVERELNEHWDWGRADNRGFLEERGEQYIYSCMLREFKAPTPGSPDSGDGPKSAADMLPAAHDKTRDLDILNRYREDLLQTSLEHLVVKLRDIRDERKNILFLSEGWAPHRPVPPEAPSPFKDDPPTRPPVGVGRGGTFGRIPADNVLTSLPESVKGDDCRAALQRLMDMDFAQRFDDLVTEAARANVTFYPIDVGGLKTDLSASGDMNTLRTLAEANDGSAVVNTNDIAAGFRRISEQVSAYYLLGYYSTNETRDGTFRKIEVKVGGRTVSARRGYFAFAPPAPPASSAPAIRPGITEALAALGRLDSPQDVFAYAVPRAGGLDVVVDLASRLVDAGRWAGGGLAVATVNAGATSTSASMPIEPGRRAALVHVAGVSGPGVPRVSVEISGDGTPVGTSFTASDAAGAPLVCRGAASARAPLQPAAEFLFRRGERLHLEWAVAAAGMERSARLLDRRGQPLPVTVTTTEQPGNGGVLIAADLVLAGFADGDYVLELSIGQGAQIERKPFAFRVRR
jgi:VWFA-related protein